MAVNKTGYLIGAVAGAGIAAAALAGTGMQWPPAKADQSSLIKASTAPIFAPPPGAPMSFADIFDRVSPAVVSIDVRSRVNRRSLQQIPGFENFPFNIVPRGPGGQGQGQEGEEPAPPPQAMSSGSGFFISADGYIVTNNHVVENAEEITVRLNDDRELTATLVGSDPETDLAVLRVEGGNFPFVRFETEARPRVGDWVLAIGNPLGLGGTVTAGVVSAYGRQNVDPRTAYVDYMQIDAPINRGNSGGPTFDIHGRVIGVNSAILSPNGYSVGIGFAIPADTANRITQQLISGGSVQRGYVGITVGSVTDDIREALALPEGLEGAYVSGVNAGGPGERGGLQEGDIVVAVNGEDVSDNTELTRRVAAVNVGETVAFDILRNGDRRTVNVRAVARPSARELAELNAEPDQPTLPEGASVPAGESAIGLTLAPVSPQVRELYGLEDRITGLVITEVQPRTRFARLGVLPGDVLTRADNRPLRSVEDLRGTVQRLRAAGRPSVLLSLNRGGQSIPVVVELDELPVADSQSGR